MDFTPIGSAQSKTGTLHLKKKNWQHCQLGIHYKWEALEKALFEANKQVTIQQEKDEGA
jgi:hypothetical protein